MNTLSNQQLTADLKALVNDAEALVKATAADAGGKFAGVHDRLAGSLKTARSRVSEMEEAVVAQSRAAARTTDRYVHQSPWVSIGVAAAASLVLGMLIARR